MMNSSEYLHQSFQDWVREATLDDASAMAKINYDGWTQSYRGVVDDDFLDSIDLQRKQQRMLEHMKDDAWISIRLVYVMNGNIVWFVHWGEKRDEDIPYEAEIYAIYVDPATQWQGVGKALMKKLMETKQFRNKKTFYLWTLKERAATRWFYEKLWGKVFAEKEHEIWGKKYPMVWYYRQK